MATTMTATELKLQKELNAAQAELKKLKEVLAKERGERDDYKRKLENANAELNKVKAESKKLREAEADLAKLRKEIEALKSKPASVPAPASAPASAPAPASIPTPASVPAPASVRTADDLMKSTLLSSDEAALLRRKLAEAYEALDQVQELARKERVVHRLMSVDLT